MKFRVAFLPLTAAATAITAVTHGLAVGAAETDPAPVVSEAPSPKSRMGAAIRDDVDAERKRASERERRLKLRERALAAAEKRLSDKMTQDDGAVAEPLPSPAEAESERFGSLARIYQGMKPKKAAAVFEKLDLRMQVEVAMRMKERSVALIIAYMDPAQAAALTTALAEPSKVAVKASETRAATNPDAANSVSSGN